MPGVVRNDNRNFFQWLTFQGTNAILDAAVSFSQPVSTIQVASFTGSTGAATNPTPVILFSFQPLSIDPTILSPAIPFGAGVFTLGPLVLADVTIGASGETRAQVAAINTFRYPVTDGFLNMWLFDAASGAYLPGTMGVVLVGSPDNITTIDTNQCP